LTLKSPRICLLCLAFLAPFTVRAQGIAAPDKKADGVDLDTGPNSVIPVKGFNASVNTSSQHDSSNGWSSVLTPDAAFRFNRHFSFDASIPLYIYIVVEDNTGTKARPIDKYTTLHHAPGDTQLNGHFETHSDLFDYNFTATLGLPSGNTAYGLGAGQVTYAINNHFEHAFDFFTPDIELGFSDVNDLSGAPVRKSYITVGNLAYFQAGGSLDLPLRMTFDAEAYENLPVGSTTVYSTTGKGKKKVTTATNEGAAEDNGFNTELDVPLGRHTIFSGFYNRSLRNKIDTAGFSLTFLLKATPLPKEETK
jgi:hypothetical protein